MTTYLVDNEGKFIPPTQRPDGTWRKARRVRGDYVPQEEVPLYESKGKQFAQRKTGLPPGMCPKIAEAARKEREKQERAKAKKEEKALAAVSSNNKKQKQQTAGVLVIPSATSAKSANTTIPKIKAPISTALIAATDPIDSLSKDLQSTLNVQDDEQELGKKLKKLRKKLREIEGIEDKIKSGELKKPEKDQLDKVKRKKEILKEIKRLEEEQTISTEPCLSNGCL